MKPLFEQELVPAPAAQSMYVRHPFQQHVASPCRLELLFCWLDGYSSGTLNMLPRRYCPEADMCGQCAACAAKMCMLVCKVERWNITKEPAYVSAQCQRNITESTCVIIFANGIKASKIE